MISPALSLSLTYRLKDWIGPCLSMQGTFPEFSRPPAHLKLGPHSLHVLAQHLRDALRPCRGCRGAGSQALLFLIPHGLQRLHQLDVRARLIQGHAHQLQVKAQQWVPWCRDCISSTLGGLWQVHQLHIRA